MSYKEISGLTSEGTDRVKTFERICQIQKLDVAKVKNDLKIKSPMISIDNIFELVKTCKGKITANFIDKTFTVVVKVIEAKGEKIINAPEHIENTKADFVQVKTPLEEKFDDIDEDEEEDPF
jgi:hypothetical protein